MVSRRVSYMWLCSGCDSTQETPVWRLLDSRERGDVIEQPGAGLSFVVCPQCGTAAEIDAPLLVIRPDTPLPLLLGVHVRELGGPPLTPPSGPVLEQEVRAALGRNTAGIAGPMIPLPRILIPVVLMRDVNADAADPDPAVQEIFGPEMTLPASWYRSFLQIVRDSEPDRRLATALRELWNVPPQELGAFLHEYPELSTAEAVTAVRAELDGIPRPSEDDPVLEQFRLLMQARLDLISGLATGRPPAEVVTDYVAKLEQGSNFVDGRLEELLGAVSADPGVTGIPPLREALEMAIGLRREDLEADLSADLGARLWSQPVTDNATIEESISLLTRALGLIPEGDQRWAGVANNLGNAYQRRVSGDAIENWETAWRLIQRACDAVDGAADPSTWARFQMNYGFCLGERPGGSSVADISRGIDHIRSSLEERSPERNVIDWAYSLLNLGLLHQRRRALGDDVIARDCYEQALAHLRPDDDLQLWATLQNNRADLLLAAETPDLDDVKMSISAALAEVNPVADPLTAGRMTWQLARVAEHPGGPLTPEPLRLRRDALNLLSPLLAPDWHLKIGGELLDAYSQMNGWHAAAALCTTMLTAFDNLYDSQTSAEGRRMVLQRNPRLARSAAYVFACAGRPEDAVEVIEHGRARQLSVAVSRDTADLTRLAAVDQPLADRYRATLSRYRAALNQARMALIPGGAESRFTAIENDMRQVLSDIRDIPGFERFLQPMTVADISSSADGQPVIYLVSAPSGSYALIVQADDSGEPSVTSISVPGVTSRDIALLVLVGENGEPGLISAQSAGPWASQLLRSALGRLGEIEPLLRPVADTLASAAQHIAVVIPTGLLGLIPIPAAAVGGQILDDIGEIHLAPSAAAYAASRIRASQQRPQHLVGVADPDGTLPGSRAELAAIRGLFEPGSPTSCAVGPDATRTWVLDNVSAASHLHLACHGASTVGSTTGGVLRLAGDDVLTVDDLLDGRLASCRLAVASACQSGHYETAAAPDEFAGLPAGFLQAGAACAVASLWQVRDDVTSLFMTRFYELLDPAHKGSPQRPVSALRQARAWLRRLTPQQAEAFRQMHPHLSGPSDGRGEPVPAALDTIASTGSYSSPENWAAFVAWGC
jgi:CHAT domain-containing protein/tetratricopeptide (TPR) repeat protein